MLPANPGHPPTSVRKNLSRMHQAPSAEILVGVYRETTIDRHVIVNIQPGHLASTAPIDRLNIRYRNELLMKELALRTFLEQGYDLHCNPAGREPTGHP